MKVASAFLRQQEVRPERPSSPKPNQNERNETKPDPEPPIRSGQNGTELAIQSIQHRWESMEKRENREKRCTEAPTEPSRAKGATFTWKCSKFNQIKVNAPQANIFRTPNERDGYTASERDREREREAGRMCDEDNRLATRRKFNM